MSTEQNKTMHPIFGAIKERYGTVTVPNVDTTELSTVQILKSIEKHTGATDIKLADVYDWMIANGYKQQAREDMEFVWLLQDLEVE